MEIWVMGAGRFGRRAIRMLAREQGKILAVDRNPRALEALPAGAETLCAEAADFLAGNMTSDSPDWVVPAVPLHLAYLWILRMLEQDREARMLAPPPEMEARVPHPMRGEGGCLYMSVADFLCPEDCPEPADFCTHTGKPREESLYRVLEDLRLPGWKSVALRSRQLAPGVGGYRPRALFAALDAVKNAGMPVILSTACRCHGVADGLRAGHG